MSFCAVSAELIKPLFRAHHLSLLPPCHHSRAVPGEPKHFFFPLHTLSPWQVQSLANRAKWIISFPFLIISHGNSFLWANSAVLLKATLTPSVIILSISAFCHCILDFRASFNSWLPCGVLDAHHVQTNWLEHPEVFYSLCADSLAVQYTDR